MNWDKITKDEKVKQLLIDRAYIEEEIKRLDENALIMYELEVLSIPDVVEQSEQLKALEDLKDFAYDNCQPHNSERLSEIMERL